MNRLTSKRVNGIKTGYWSPAKKEELIQRLGEYEDLGMGPEDIRELRSKLSMFCGRASMLLQFPGNPEQLLLDILSFGKMYGIYDQEKEKIHGKTTD